MRSAPPVSAGQGRKRPRSAGMSRSSSRASGSRNVHPGGGPGTNGCMVGIHVETEVPTLWRDPISEHDRERPGTAPDVENAAGGWQADKDRKEPEVLARSDFEGSQRTALPPEVIRRQLAFAVQDQGEAIDWRGEAQESGATRTGQGMRPPAHRKDGLAATGCMVVVPRRACPESGDRGSAPVAGGLASIGWIVLYSGAQRVVRPPDSLPPTGRRRLRRWTGPAQPLQIGDAAILMGEFGAGERVGTAQEEPDECDPEPDPGRFR